MNLREGKRDVWGGPQSFIGRFKNHKVVITALNGGNWYVLIDDLKNDKAHNSLWEEKRFVDIESAKAYALNWIKVNLATTQP